MPKTNKKDVKILVPVREHPRHVPASGKNPTGITIVDQHLRRLPGTYLDPSEIEAIYKSYSRKNLKLPTRGRLPVFPAADSYDETIAVWTAYFNEKLMVDPPLEPNVIKALIGSESGFRKNPIENKIAFGIAQITRSTLKILQDPKGESKKFLFGKISQKHLKDPAIAIPLMVRWLLHKCEIAHKNLKRTPTIEENILEYKGLLKSKSETKRKALMVFRRFYAALEN